jgi:transposase-like protein
MHKQVRERKIKGTGGRDKTIVGGFLERGGKVRTSMPKNRRKNTLHEVVKKNVGVGSILFTDALPSYNDLEEDYAHKVIDHAVAYVDGVVHTNGMENYWSLLKRGIKGTYVSVEPSIFSDTSMSGPSGLITEEVRKTRSLTEIGFKTLCLMFLENA